MKTDFPAPQRTTQLEPPHAARKGSNHQLERLIQLARLHYGVTMVFFSLAEEGEQRIKASHGLGLRELDRASALSTVLIQQDSPVIVPDVSQDPRFNSCAATEDPGIRFFAGIPVRASNGLKVGSLCLGDSEPKRTACCDLEVLCVLASLIEDEFANRSHVAEGQKALKNQILSRSISNAQNIFLSTDDDHAAFEVLLNDLLTLSDCAFGFIGEVLDNDSGQPYVKIRAITNISWDAETARLYDEVNKRGMVFDRLDNLIGAPVVTRDVVISENVQEDHRRGGTPAGHPPIATYIGIPVFSGSKLVGLIGLANRPGGFSRQFAHDLEPLSTTVGTLIERKRLHALKAQQYERAERAANFDLLTGLPNRRLLTQLFDKRISEADATGSSLSICFIDLDGFKEVNDTYGHEAGDAVLQGVANRLSSVIRSADVLARLSGDEFVAILNDADDSHVYQRMLECLDDPISYDGRTIKITGSMGVTLYPADNSDRDVLLRHADKAMYAAKELGKNQVSFYSLDQHQSCKNQPEKPGSI